MEGEEIAHRWQQYIELFNDLEELEELEREEEITPKELGPTITKAEFERKKKHYTNWNLKKKNHMV